MPQAPQTHSHRMLAVIIIGVVLIVGVWLYMSMNDKDMKSDMTTAPKTPAQTLTDLHNSSDPVTATPAAQAKELKKLDSMSKKSTTPLPVRIKRVHDLNR